MNCKICSNSMIDFLNDNIDHSTTHKLTVLFNEKFGTSKKIHEIRYICAKNNIRRSAVRHTITTEEMINFLNSNINKLGYIELAESFNKQFGTRKTATNISNMCYLRGINKGFHRFKYTKEMISFLCKNAFEISRKLLTQRFNSKFKTDRSVEEIRRKCGNCKYNSINTGDHFYTEAMFSFLSSIVDSNSWQHITDEFNNKFKTNKTVVSVRDACLKKGLLNNKKITHEIGAEIVNDGYISVKISEQNGWIHKHILLWTQAYGKIPKGFCILFADGNRSNLSLDNLVMVSRSELSYMNVWKLRFKNSDATKAGVNIVKVILKTRERQKEIGKSNVEGEIKQKEGQ